MSGVGRGTVGCFVPLCVRCDEPENIRAEPQHCTLLSSPVPEHRASYFGCIGGLLTTHGHITANRWESSHLKFQTQLKWISFAFSEVSAVAVKAQ